MDSRFKPRLLCLCPKSADGFPGSLIAHFDARTVRDAPAAINCARKATYDCYLAYGTPDSRAAVEFWTQLREFDPNTPFVILSEAPLDDAIQQRLRPGFDIHATAPCSAYELLLLVQCLINSAELRSLRARIDEARAIAHELDNRLRDVEHRMYSAGASIARAETHMMKAQALKAFTEAGGAPAYFRRHWPETLEHVLHERDGTAH